MIMSYILIFTLQVLVDVIHLKSDNNKFLKILMSSKENRKNMKRNDVKHVYA